MLFPLLLTAAAATAAPSGFGPALADADLATHAAVTIRPTPGRYTPLDLRPTATVLVEQMDNWWADDGVTLLASAR